MYKPQRHGDLTAALLYKAELGEERCWETSVRNLSYFLQMCFREKNCRRLNVKKCFCPILDIAIWYQVAFQNIE